MRGEKILEIAFWVVVGVAIAAVLGFVLGLIVMLLWNWLMPVLFGLPAIGYWQAVGLFVLCHLLFTSHQAHHEEDDGRRGRRVQVFGHRVRTFLREEDEAAPESG